jgi:hypothetical protein
MYISRDWTDAQQAFEALVREYPDDPVYRLYLERTSGDVDSIPDDWDGVFNHG